MPYVAWGDSLRAQPHLHEVGSGQRPTRRLKERTARFDLTYVHTEESQAIDQRRDLRIGPGIVARVEQNALASLVPGLGKEVPKRVVVAHAHAPGSENRVAENAI